MPVALLVLSAILLVTLTGQLRCNKDGLTGKSVAFEELFAVGGLVEKYDALQGAIGGVSRIPSSQSPPFFANTLQCAKNLISDTAAFLAKTTEAEACACVSGMFTSIL